MSRFLDRLGEEPHRTLLHEIFGKQIEWLGSVVPDLGRHTARDATGLSARRKDEQGAKPEKEKMTETAIVVGKSQKTVVFQRRRRISVPRTTDELMR